MRYYIQKSLTLYIIKSKYKIIIIVVIKATHLYGIRTALNLPNVQFYIFINLYIFIEICVFG